MSAREVAEEDSVIDVLGRREDAWVGGVVFVLERREGACVKAQIQTLVYGDRLNRPTLPPGIHRAAR